MSQLPLIYESKEQPRLKVVFVSGVKLSGIKMSYLAGEIEKTPQEFSEMLSGANSRRYDIDHFQITLDNLHEAGCDLPRKIAEWFHNRYCKTPEQTRDETIEEIRAIGKSVQAANDRLPVLLKMIEAMMTAPKGRK